MRTLYAELTKLSGSLVWLVVTALPILAVLSGSITGIDASWDTLWVRSLGFYGMALLPVGVAIIASLTWSVEHRAGNWAALLAQPVSIASIVAAKAAVVTALSGCMQITMLAAVCAAGKLGFGLPGLLPGTYWVTSALIVLACAPVAALQSLLSLTTQSFAIPVAFALLATGISTTALLVGLPGALCSPYALATFATQLGSSLVDSSSTRFNTAELSAGSGAALAAYSLVFGCAIVCATALVVSRRDVRS